MKNPDYFPNLRKRKYAFLAIVLVGLMTSSWVRVSIGLSPYDLDAARVIAILCISLAPSFFLLFLFEQMLKMLDKYDVK